MKINFDINNTPPTQGKIDEVRNRLEKYSSAIRRSWPLGLLVVFGSGYLGWSLFHWLMTYIVTTVSPGYVSFMAFMISIVVSGQLLIIGNKWLGYCDTEIDRLSVIDPYVAEEALRLAKAHSAIELYRIEVVRSGRRLTNGEFRAMKDFSADARVKTTESSNKEQVDAAFDKLHQV